MPFHRLLCKLQSQTLPDIKNLVLHVNEMGASMEGERLGIVKNSSLNLSSPFVLDRGGVKVNTLEGVEC